MWYETFNDIFFVTVISIIGGGLGLSLKFCLKSKCDNINCCWGLIKIHRNVELELTDIEENKNENEENKI